MEPDVPIITPFISSNSCGIFLSSKNDLFTNSNDFDNKKNEPNKQEDKIIKLFILLVNKLSFM